MRTVVILAFTAATGCIGQSDDPQDSLDELAGLTHPMVLQGIVLGIE